MFQNLVFYSLYCNHTNIIKEIKYCSSIGVVAIRIKETVYHYYMDEAMAISFADIEFISKMAFYQRRIKGHYKRFRVYNVGDKVVVDKSSGLFFKKYWYKSGVIIDNGEPLTVEIDVDGRKEKMVLMNKEVFKKI